MRRALTLLTCLSTVLAITGTTPAQAAGDTRVRLPITTFHTLLVDEPHNHVLLSTDSRVVAVSRAGAVVATIPNLPDVRSLALSPDGSLLYAAATTANRVAVYNASTLALVRNYSDLRCPTSMATAASKVWISSGCSTGYGSPSIASIDPTTGTLTNFSPKEYWHRPPRLAAGSPTSSSLVAVEVGNTDGTQVVYDVSGGSPVAQASWDAQCGIWDVTVSPDNRTIASSCTNMGSGLMTFDPTGAPGTTYVPGSAFDDVSFSHDGAFVAIAEANRHASALEVYAAGQPSVVTLSRSIGQWEYLTGGPIFGPSGDLYSVISRNNYGSYTYDLLVVHQAARHPMVLTVNAPTTTTRGTTITASGTLSSPTSDLGPNKPLTLTRTDLAGTHALGTVTTDSSGAYSFSDTPTIGGSVTYAGSWPGDATHFPVVTKHVVTIPRTATTISITTNATSYPYGGKALLTAHLGRTYNSRVASLYATPYGQKKVLVRRAAVDSHGNLTGAYVMTRKTTFEATFAGDYRTAPASARRTVIGRGSLTVGLRYAYARSGSYYLVHQQTSPMLTGNMRPWKQACLTFRTQAYTNGRWGNDYKSRCYYGAGSLFEFLSEGKTIGVRFRARWEWHGDAATPATTSPWLYLRFTR